MTEEQRDKLRRAIALPGWRWMAGMVIENADGPVRIDSVDDDGSPGVLRRCRWTNDVYSAEVRSGPLPDPDDHATAGCLLALLSVVDAGADPDKSGWWSVSPDGDRYYSGPSLGWACVEAALALGRWPGGA